ncbi:MAG: hypothetical protein E7177_02760 [Erysipelotrichaceae bacterium]|nr:hypothetical protein [Erysipelotrichaceae bacterium]
MNLLITISDIFVMANVGLLVGLIVPLLILLFFAKYRGIWASIWLLPLLFFGYRFAMTFEVVSSFVTSNAIVNPIAQGFEAFMLPFEVSVHKTIMDLLSLIAPGVDLWQKTILGATWFPLALYAILWLLFLAIFKKRRKRKKTRRYEDDF